MSTQTTPTAAIPLAEMPNQITDTARLDRQRAIAEAGDQCEQIMRLMNDRKSEIAKHLKAIEQVLSALSFCKITLGDATAEISLQCDLIRALL